MKTRKMTTRDWGVPTLFVAGTIWAAFNIGGCATFQHAESDIPGTVMAGLSTAACVTAAVKEEPDALLRERRIADCFKAAFDALSEASKRELLSMGDKP